MSASVTRPEDTALFLANHCAGLEAENAKLRDQLRWRKWPEERPTEKGEYQAAIWYMLREKIWLEHMFFRPNDPFGAWGEREPDYWRPIGPMPGGE